MKLGGKKIIVLGDRDGVHGEEISDALEQMGHKPVFSCTECFVCTAAGSVDFPNQQKIKEIVQGKSPQEFVVILGACDPEGAGVHAQTVTTGDPSYAGSLSEVKLHLPVYHMFEQEIKDQIDKSVYEKSIKLLESSLDRKQLESITGMVKKIREEGS